MSRSQATILTNMCLIEDDHGNIVMQIRDPQRYSWSGAALPGGHIEAHEGLVESVIREVKEETGLTIKNPKLVGMKHWYPNKFSFYSPHGLKNNLRIILPLSLSVNFYTFYSMQQKYKEVKI